MSGCSHASELQPTAGASQERPEILKNAQPDRVVRLDVRPIVAGGTKPCGAINDAAGELREGEILHIINSFQPGSLYQRMEQRGYDHWTESNGTDWHIWFYKA